jgi:hypothetical protein
MPVTVHTSLAFQGRSPDVDDGASALAAGDVADADISVVGLGTDGVLNPEVASWHAQTRNAQSASAKNRMIMCTSC